MNSTFKKGLFLCCLVLGSLFLALADSRQTNLTTEKNNTIYQMAHIAAETVTSTAPVATSTPYTTISPTPTVRPTEAPTVSELYMEYKGGTISSPVVLTKDDFLVTAVMSDGSSKTITDYTFTSKTEISEPGETTISIAYEGKTSSCVVTYYVEGTQTYYSVIFDSMGGNAVAPILSISPNSTIRLPENPERDGYWFRGWYLDEECTKEFNITTRILQDYTLYALWEEKEYPEQNTMSTYMVFEEPNFFFCNLTIDLTEQTYGAHTVPDVEPVSYTDISIAAKNISDSTKYFAFNLDVADYNFNSTRPLSTTITIPSNFGIDRICVFYTPDEHHIQGMCHGEANTIDTYTFLAYAPGTYIVMEMPDVQTTPSPEPTIAPSITLSLASSVSVNGQKAAQVKYYNFDEEVLAPEELTLIWKSSNTKVATVSKDGIVTGIKNGTATITVTSSDKQFTASAKIKVGTGIETIKITKLSLNKTKVSLKKGKTFSIKATISPSNATTKKLTYSSTNKKIATVSTKGVIKAKKKGSCKIKVTTTDGSKLTKTIKVTVK